MPLQPGDIVAGYRVLRVLGSGGMGTVYLAQNPTLPRQDALKVLSADLSTDAEFRARFEREANLAAGLDHPNIVAVYNRGEEEGLLWIAMQYVPGTDAAEEAKKDRAAMTPQRALRIIGEVGKGIDYAHRRGLLHRDVKPANFLLAKADGAEEERVLLTDFGVAKSSEDGQDLTRTGTFMATVAFASPEQLTGGELDHHSDIYSLGCAFYRLLAGQNPYPATMPAVTIMGHVHEPPPKLSSVRQDLPTTLDAVFEKVLAKDPSQRYPTCRDFVHDAEAALHGYATDPRVSIQGFAPRGEETDRRLAKTLKSGPQASRRRAILASGVAAVVAIAITVGAFLIIDRGGASGGGEQLASVRSDYPQFDGKTVAAFNIGNGTFSVVLNPSDQAKFLHQIGFRYDDKFKAVGNEKSPRQLSSPTSSYLSGISSDVIIALRTDSQAGNGGLRGLPSSIMSSDAAIVVVDDPSTVQAFQVWTDQSTRSLVDKMVPMIGKVVK